VVPQTLNKVVALEKGIKPRASADFTAAYQLLQKAPLLSGISRTYKAKDDDDKEQLPPEQTRVQIRATDVIKDVERALTRLFDITITKDKGNATARADIEVDGETIAENVPATTLLFLEKHLGDVHTFVAKLPVLDPADTWVYDPATDAFATPATQTVRSKKVPRNHVRAEATDKHPAQVEMYYEDVLVGNWTTTKFSGALPQARVNELRTRVLKLMDAVKVAREQANTTEAPSIEIGTKIFGYLFA